MFPSSSSRYDIPKTSQVYDNTSCFIYSTFIGGSELEIGSGIAIDLQGASYITGETESNDFLTYSALDDTFNGSSDGFITKLNPEGTINYSTFIGGNNQDGGTDILIDESGYCFIAGTTKSEDFPILNAFDSSLGAAWEGISDGFLTKLNPDGSLNFSNYLGGTSDELDLHIAVDDSGACFITGITHSLNFPLQNAYDEILENREVFVMKFNPDGSINFSTYLGGNHHEDAYGIVADSNGGCYVTGRTFSDDFPTLNEIDDEQDGVTDAFLARFNQNGSMIFCTLIGGGSEDEANGVALDNIGNCYIMGDTDSTNFPLQNPIDHSLSGERDCFISKFGPYGDLLYSTYWGGDSHEYGTEIFVDSNNSYYITGRSSSNDFPEQFGFSREEDSESRFFVTKFNSDDTLNYSYKFGGSSSEEPCDIKIYNNGVCYIGGFTSSIDFPLKNAFDTSNVYYEAFLCEIYAPSGDEDGDGIPNYWEYQKGMNLSYALDASYDFDRDGLTNLQEYLSGTDPYDDDTDNDGINDLNDHYPNSFMRPVGWIIIISSISVVGLSISIVLIKPLHKFRQYKVRKSLEAIQLEMDDLDYDSAEKKIEETLPKISECGNKDLYSKAKTMKKSCEYNQMFLSKLNDHRKWIDERNFQSAHENLVHLLKQIHQPEYVEIVDKKIESEITDLLKMVSEKLENEEK